MVIPKNNRTGGIFFIKRKLLRTIPTDKKTQERTILFYLEQADDSLAFLKKEMESRTKLYRSLGMAAGLFILVLFA